jgi:carboxylesterase type B
VFEDGGLAKPEGFSIGSSNNLAYNGQHFAENQDVVVVTFKY